MPPLASATDPQEATNVRAVSSDVRSAMTGDPAPGTTQDPHEGKLPIDEPWLRGYPPIAQETPGFDVAAMRRFVDGEQAAIKNRVRALLSQPSFRYYPGTDKDGLRAVVFDWAKEVALAGFGGMFMPKSVGGADDLAGFMAAFETLGFHDISLFLKFGVQF